MNAIRTTLLLISLTFVLASCNDNDDVIDDFGQEILITDDVDCCSVDEARQVYEFIRKQKEITSLTQDIDDKYRLRVFSPTGSLHTGYNDLYFVVTKIVSANYVKDIEIKSFTPIMSMSSGMEHSTPFSGSIDNFDNGLLAIRHGWVSFVMNTSDNGSWNLDISRQKSISRCLSRSMLWLMVRNGYHNSRWEKRRFISRLSTLRIGRLVPTTYRLK